jgi:hypothetical protein
VLYYERAVPGGDKLLAAHREICERHENGGYRCAVSIRRASSGVTFRDDETQFTFATGRTGMTGINVFDRGSKKPAKLDPNAP